MKESLGARGGGFKCDSCGSRVVFLPPHEAPHETLQACFLLKLQPAMPVTLPFVTKLQEITGGKGFYVE